MNGLEKIVNKILAEAEAYRATVTAQFEAKAKETANDYAARARDLREKFRSDAARDAADRVARAESAAEMTTRRAMLSAKSEMLDEVFDRALRALRALGPEDYFSLLTKLTCDAVTGRARLEAENCARYGEAEANVSEWYELLLSASDRAQYGERLLAAVREKTGADGEKLFLAPDAAAIDGGIVLRCGEIEVCASLSALIADARTGLEHEVCGILFD